MDVADDEVAAAVDDAADDLALSVDGQRLERVTATQRGHERGL